MLKSYIMNLIDELKKYRSICFYPSCGTDLSDIDFFCSGRLPLEERKTAVSAQKWDSPFPQPEVFLHTDVNFYMEFEEGTDLDLADYGIHGKFEILGFEQLDIIEKPNRINGNPPFSGQCYKYVLKVWGQDKPVVLLLCICENEFAASQILLKNSIKADFIWSKNWNGGRTYGTWLARIATRLETKLFYSDWLCIPGQRGEPSNAAVYEKYPELKPVTETVLKRTANHWIEEGAHGWVDEFVPTMEK